ncbi:hypothetical protein Glove_290g87 [Diversispora epigaea]|uniref:Uncharacterized protein n=1 Tax=Diversispora epigaea TaxID=1348612 RepID=A0A397I0I0_9GLOM|nr:hypothetical protein Glove_290g87 [Diversispora epigaea]
MNVNQTEFGNQEELVAIPPLPLKKHPRSWQQKRPKNNNSDNGNINMIVSIFDEKLFQNEEANENNSEKEEVLFRIGKQNSLQEQEGFAAQLVNLSTN